MDLNIYAIFDVKTERHMVPWYMHSHNEATRAFTNLINGDHQVSRNPQDYELWYLGTWDDETGQFDQDRKHIVSGNAVTNRETFTPSQVDAFSKTLQELKEALLK